MVFRPSPKLNPDETFDPSMVLPEKPIAKSPEIGETQATGISMRPDPQ